MKKLMYLLFFLMVGISNAQVITFTDNDFRLKLLESDVSNNIAKTLGGGSIKIDADNDGLITVQEVALVYELSIPNVASINSINELVLFDNLTRLDAQNCSITGVLNLSNLESLEFAFLNNNQISQINVTGCLGMIELDCDDNLLQTIDVSTLINLQNLKVANNPILQIYAKNGKNEVIDFSGTLNSNINYICADEIQVVNLQGQVTNSCIVNSLCSSLPGGNYNTITGTLYFDANGNGLDVTDAPFPYAKLMSVLGDDDSETLQTVTENDARYSFTTTQIGDFDVTPSVENPSWFTILPVTSNFSNTNNNVFTQNFLLAPVGVHSDVEIMIRPVSQVIPGSNASYEIVYKNKGNQTHNGQVSFEYNESSMDFVSSTIPLVNSGTGQLSLSYSNLLPLESRNFQVVLNVNSSVNNNDVLSFTLNIDPNNEDVSTQADNSFVFRQKVQVTSPNLMKCIDGDLLPNSEIGKYLHYAINFENTGNQVARNVVIRTSFDNSKYDINSIQILNTSSPLKLNIKNQNATFNLLNAAVGGPGGQGGILLKVRSKSDLTDGSEVNARAEVFFVYDDIQVAPVEFTTALAQTTFQNLNVSSNTIDTTIRAYPNPTSTYVNIKSDTIIQSVQLFDIQGRLLQTNLESTTTSTIDLTQRVAGIYFVKVTSEKGTKVEKIIKE